MLSGLLRIAAADQDPIPDTGGWGPRESIRSNEVVFGVSAEGTLETFFSRKWSLKYTVARCATGTSFAQETSSRQVSDELVRFVRRNPALFGAFSASDDLVVTVGEFVALVPSTGYGIRECSIEQWHSGIRVHGTSSQWVLDTNGRVLVVLNRLVPGLTLEFSEPEDPVRLLSELLAGHDIVSWEIVAVARPVAGIYGSPGVFYRVLSLLGGTPWESFVSIALGRLASSRPLIVRACSTSVFDAVAENAQFQPPTQEATGQWSFSSNLDPQAWPESSFNMVYLWHRLFCENVGGFLADFDFHDAFGNTVPYALVTNDPSVVNGKWVSLPVGEVRLGKGCFDLDVISHEFGHGLVHMATDLSGTDQSRTIDEGLADAVAALVSFFSAVVSPLLLLPAGGLWKIGESIDCATVDPFGQCTKWPAGVRDLADPTQSLDSMHQLRPQPDRWDNYAVQASGTNFEVSHYNNGILNKATWLLAAGEEGEPAPAFGGIEDLVRIGCVKMTRLIRDLVDPLGSGNGLPDDLNLDGYGFRMEWTALKHSMKYLASGDTEGGMVHGRVQMAMSAVGLWKSLCLPFAVRTQQAVACASLDVVGRGNRQYVFFRRLDSQGKGGNLGSMWIDQDGLWMSAQPFARAMPAVEIPLFAEQGPWAASRPDDELRLYLMQKDHLRFIQMNNNGQWVMQNPVQPKMHPAGILSIDTSTRPQVVVVEGVYYFFFADKQHNLCFAAVQEEFDEALQGTSVVTQSGSLVSAWTCVDAVVHNSRLWVVFLPKQGTAALAFTSIPVEDLLTGKWADVQLFEDYAENHTDDVPMTTAGVFSMASWKGRCHVAFCSEGGQVSVVDDDNPEGKPTSMGLGRRLSLFAWSGSPYGELESITRAVPQNRGVAGETSQDFPGCLGALGDLRLHLFTCRGSSASLPQFDWLLGLKVKYGA